MEQNISGKAETSAQQTADRAPTVAPASAATEQKAASAPVPGPLGGGVGTLFDSGDLGLAKFRDRLVTPPLWRPRAGQTVRVEARPTRVRYHADLPEATAWGYEGSVPGPTIEVRSGERVDIDWVNRLGNPAQPATLPYDVVRVPPLAGPTQGINADPTTAIRPGGRSTTRAAGADSYPPLPNTETYHPATVVHLHGSLTNGHDDGWAHNVTRAGDLARHTYPNRQPATTLWYHDHAMAVTRFNVHAGLAGFYLVRDEIEQSLRLPSGHRELPLMIADRNLESEPGQDGGPGRFTGRLLYKQAGYTRLGAPGQEVEVGDSELPQVGPFNLVNGRIWPSKDVDAAWYRLRVVNAANSRVYSLALHDTTDERLQPGASVPNTDCRFTANRVPALVLIGTDGGLLPAPVHPVDGVLELGPGERADILVNFAEHRGRTLELRNEAGTVLNAAPGQADATVMRFVVSDQPATDHFTLPSTLNSAFEAYRHLPDGRLQVGNRFVNSHEHAWVALIPPGVDRNAHPALWELAELADEEPDGPGVIVVTRPDGSSTRLRTVAKLFDDATTIVLPEGSFTAWNILHLGGPAHPFHIHMTEFQMYQRLGLPTTTAGAVVGFDPAGVSRITAVGGRAILPEEAGFKDTWTVQAGDWMQVLGDFSGARGSFMYHCHIMDHEDHTMMRPFVVMPPETLAFHGEHDGHHH